MSEKATPEGIFGYPNGGGTRLVWQIVYDALIGASMGAKVASANYFVSILEQSY